MPSLAATRWERASAGCDDQDHHLRIPVDARHLRLILGLPAAQQHALGSQFVRAVIHEPIVG
jgi:hypothetical protein